MRKVKILLVTSYHCYECDGQSNLYPVTTDWEEVSDTEYWEMVQAISDANRMNKDDSSQYILVSYSENMKAEIFAKASEFRKSIEDARAKREEEKIKVAKKKKVTALARKQKQFARLKEELGER